VPGSPVTTDPELLRQLYVLDGLSAADIATKLGCSGATILGRLRQLGVDVRPTGPVLTGFLYKVQWRDRGLYDWFLSVGLTPAKSRTLGPLTVPDKVYADFFRGCIDGDGCVLVYTDRYHATKSPSYVYERLYVSLVSASRPFLEWIRANTQTLVGVSGAVHNSGARSGPSVSFPVLTVPPGRAVGRSRVA
jgi:hypothetical protein